MKRTCLLLMLISLLMTSCQEKSKPERVAERFLMAYLDCRYADAERIATPKVMEQMRWRISNLTQAEVELINENEPQVASEGMEDWGDSCIVTLVATDALLLDSVDLPGHIGERQFCMTLQKEKGNNWKVTALMEL